MASVEVLNKRVRCLKTGAVDGKCVIYVMSRDQRVFDNHALLAAQKHAIAKKMPLSVVFCLNPDTGYRSREHYQFMLGGLVQIENDLKEYNIPFILIIGKPEERIAGLSYHIQPDAIYFDFCPLNRSKNLLLNLSKRLNCALYVVDTHNIIPIWESSDKLEIAARTLRPIIHRKLSEFLVEPEQIAIHPYKWDGNIQSIDNLNSIIDQVLKSRPANGTILEYRSGEKYALKYLEKFIEAGLDSYAETRNDPSLYGQSQMSPYLHFGQISSLRVALLLQEEANKLGQEIHLLINQYMPKIIPGNNSRIASINALLEEIIVRKELSDNFCYFQANYNSLKACPQWAINSLESHKDDSRDYVYTFEQLENAQTHDSAWNAAQKQLRSTGKMHGYMRMYWAKKVLEWSPVRHDSAVKYDKINPKIKIIDNSCGVELIDWNTRYKDFRSKIDNLFGADWAVAVLTYLNDHYSLDGGDPNGYVGVLWAVGGVHDRPWRERQIFGTVRYMNYLGLKRKFQIESYEKHWQ